MDSTDNNAADRAEIRQQTAAASIQLASAGGNPVDAVMDAIAAHAAETEPAAGVNLGAGPAGGFLKRGAEGLAAMLSPKENPVDTVMEAVAAHEAKNPVLAVEKAVAQYQKNAENDVISNPIKCGIALREAFNTSATFEGRAALVDVANDAVSQQPVIRQAAPSAPGL